MLVALAFLGKRLTGNEFWCPFKLEYIIRVFEIRAFIAAGFAVNAFDFVSAVIFCDNIEIDMFDGARFTLFLTHLFYP
jgi:hypothetical protein